MATSSFYPVVSKETLVKEFVGKSLKDVPTPAAVLDLGKVKANCRGMLEAVESLKFGWRVHIKTHKTTELTRLQVGEGTGPVNIIVSTVLEAENILPLLLEYKAAGRPVSLLYGFPPPPSFIPRLSSIAVSLGPHSLVLLIDHPSQLPPLSQIPTPISILLKIDMGYHRAGVLPQSELCTTLISSLLALESSGHSFHGLYAHAGHSYSSTNSSTALNLLNQELSALLQVSKSIPVKPLVLSVGATPTSTSIRNLLVPETGDAGKEIAALKATISAIAAQGCSIEIHAGVYPVLDIQQLATHSLPDSLINWSSLALTILVEVASLYPGRGANGTSEALIAAGTLALGREPCKAYSGWGILSPWNRAGAEMPSKGPEEYKGWMVGGVSQEHGILKWSGEVGEQERESGEVGQKVRVWPNHACVAGSGFGWYLVVDGGDEVVDVWPRWRGW